MKDEDVQADWERFGINYLTKEESYYKMIMRNFPRVHYVYLWCRKLVKEGKEVWITDEAENG